LPGDLNEFLDVLNTHPGQVDTDLRQAGLDIWQFHYKSSSSVLRVRFLFINLKVTLSAPTKFSDIIFIRFAVQPGVRAYGAEIL
jgi:hypothetical protein